MDYVLEITVGCIIWSALVLFVTLVYIVLLVQMFRHRNTVPYTHTFFRISFQLGIADVLMIAYSMFWYRLPSAHVFPYRFIEKMSTDARIIFAGSDCVFIDYILHVQIIGVILLSVNRYTSLRFPLQHKTVRLKCVVQHYTLLQLWTPNRLLLAFVCQWCIPLLSSGWWCVFQIVALLTDFDPDLATFDVREKCIYFHKQQFAVHCRPHFSDVHQWCSSNCNHFIDVNNK
jgi:hypothetical protein